MEGRKGIWNTTPTFLYPHGSNLSIVTELVCALERRDFRVPGVQVSFHFNGRGTVQFKNVGEIVWGDIRLWFCYVQGPLPGFEDRLNDTSDLAECHIQGHSVRFYSDSSGSPYFKYIGSDWNRDKNAFRQMQYESENCPFRTYSKFISNDQKAIFTSELAKFIAYIETFPTTDAREFKNSLAEDEVDFQRYRFDVYPDHYPTLYVCRDFYHGRELIKNFKASLSGELADVDKIAFGGGKRLVPGRSIANSIPTREEVPYADIASDGFAWATLDLEKELEQFKGYHPSCFDTYLIIEVRPHYVDDIYVAELSHYHDYRKECFKTTDSLTDKQDGYALALRGIEIVSLKEYIEGNMAFKAPQYLIRKNIGHDEILRIHRIRNEYEVKRDGLGDVEVISRNFAQ